MPANNESQPHPCLRSFFGKPAFLAACFFMATSLLMAIFVLLPVPVEEADFLNKPLWLRAVRFFGRAFQALMQPESSAAELIFIPAIAAFGAWAACRCLLPERFMECVVAGVACGFAPSLLSMLSHGVAREAFGCAVIPLFLFLLLRQAGQVSRKFEWRAFALFALVVVFLRPVAPAAVLVGTAALLYVRAQGAVSTKFSLSWIWPASFALALLVYLAANRRLGIGSLSFNSNFA